MTYTHKDIFAQAIRRRQPSGVDSHLRSNSRVRVLPQAWQRTMASHGASEVRGFQWRLRQHVTRLAVYFEKGTTKKYPKTSDAIGSLRSALEAEMRQRRKGVEVTPTVDSQPPDKKRKVPVGTSRKHY